MRRCRSRHLLFAALLAGLCLFLLGLPAEAVSIAYDRNDGTTYMEILQNTSAVPLEPKGCARGMVELFQDRGVDAVEVYAFQAERFLRGASEPLYWYPHFTARIVFAVREDAPMTVTDWKDLDADAALVLPGMSPEREIFLLALAQRMTSDTDTSFAQLAQMRKEGTLRFYPMIFGTQPLLKTTDERDVYVLFAHDANRLIRRGARLRIVEPQGGTLAFTKGILSRKPITFSDTLPAELTSAGYLPAAPSAVSGQTVPPDFLRALRMANARYHTEITGLSRLTPHEPHERLPLLVGTLVLTVVWGVCIHRRVLHHGTRRAVLLLIAMLLLWELDRTIKIITLRHDDALERMLWYFYYVFRAGISVALLWISWASDEDVLNRSMPPWLKAVFGVNLLCAVLILCNDFHHQFFYFTWNADTMMWDDHLAWAAYVYWTLWFGEIAAALLLLLKKAGQQQVLRPAMAGPFLVFASYILYTIVYWLNDTVRLLELTIVTALFFLLLVETCLRTGLIPSNRFHEAFFLHARLGMQLVNAAGTPVFISPTRPNAAEDAIRISRMEIHGGALLWQEDLSLLHERQRQLALSRDALERTHALLQEEHTLRKKLLGLTLRRKLSEELEAILARKRPLLRDFRAQLMAAQNEAEVALLIRRLNLLSSYLKKRCVLFLKGQGDGTLRTDELEMAVSETCTYLRPLGLHVGVTWAHPASMCAATALVLFDAFAEFLSRAAEEETESVFCRFTDTEVTFLLDPAAWAAPWAEAQAEMWGASVMVDDCGYALALTVCPAGTAYAATVQEEQASTSMQQTQRREARPWND